MEKLKPIGDEYLSIEPNAFQVSNPHCLFIREKTGEKQNSPLSNSDPDAEQNIIQESNLKKVEPKKKSTIISRSIFFPRNSVELSLAAQQELTSLSRMLVNNPKVEVKIRAYADDKEENKGIYGIRIERAENAEKFLMEISSVSKDRIEKISDEKIKNKSSVQSLNRRVDIELLKEY